MLSQNSYAYILANKTNTVLYTGSTTELRKRVYQHKNKLLPGFTSKYNVDKLVWYEVHEGIENAGIREKHIKGGSRQKKIKLIESINPTWKDLFEDILE